MRRLAIAPFVFHSEHSARSVTNERTVLVDIVSGGARLAEDRELVEIASVFAGVGG